MGDNRLARVVIAAAVAGGMACLMAAPTSAQSLTDRFKSLFGGKSDEPAAATPGAAGRAGHRRPDLSAGHGPGRCGDLCGGAARQAAGRQRSALSGHDHQDGPRMHRQWRGDHRTDRHSGPRHRRSRRRSAVGAGSDPRRGGAGRRHRKDHRHQGLPDHGQHDGKRQRAVHAGGRRSDLSGAVGRGRRHLHLLCRLRPAGPETRAPRAAKEASEQQQKSRRERLAPASVVCC